MRNRITTVITALLLASATFGHVLRHKLGIEQPPRALKQIVPVLAEFRIRRCLRLQAGDDRG